MAKKMSKDTKILIGAAALAALVLFTNPSSSGGGGGWADGDEKLKKTVEEVPASVADTGIGQAFQDAPITAVFEPKKQAFPTPEFMETFVPFTAADIRHLNLKNPDRYPAFMGSPAAGFTNMAGILAPIIKSSPTQYIKKVASQPTYKSGGGVTLVKKSAGMIGNRRNTINIISRGGYNY